VVEVWKTSPNSQVELARVTEKGYRAIISTPWYLNRIGTQEDWKIYYAYEPTNFNGNYVYDIALGFILFTILIYRQAGIYSTCTVHWYI